MIKHFISFIICSCFILIYAQVVEIDLPPSVNKSGVHLMPAYVQEDSSLVIFNMKKDSVEMIKLSHDLKELGRKSTSLPVFNNRLVGKIVKKNHATLIFSNNKFKRYSILKFDHLNNQVLEAIIDSKPFKKDVILSMFEYGNKFHVLTVRRYRSKLNLYVFDASGQMKIHRFEFEPYQFLKNYMDIFPLITKEEKRMQFESGLQRIDPFTMYNIETASIPSKLYLRGKELIISLDDFKNQTDLIRINLDNYNLSTETFEYIQTDSADNLSYSANSFLQGDSLYQLKMSKENLNIQVIDLISKQTVRSIGFSKTESISIKNTPLIKDGAIFTSEKKLSETGVFLKKLDKLNAGISVYQAGNSNIITVGGHSEPIVPIPFYFAGTFSATFGVLVFKYSKALHFQCLFDQNLNHISGSMADLQPLENDPAKLAPEFLEKNKNKIEDWTKVINGNQQEYWYFDTEKESYFKYVVPR